MIRRAPLLVGTAVLGLLSACASQPPVTAFDPPGFFSGAWHGLVIVPSVIIGLFTDVRVYAFPNSGYWYDVGFVLGAVFGLGGTAAVAAGNS